MDWRRTEFAPVSSVWKWTQETRTKFEPDTPVPLFMSDVIDITIYFTIWQIILLFQCTENQKEMGCPLLVSKYSWDTCDINAFQIIILTK